MKTTIAIATAFLIALSFWCGTEYGLKNCIDCSDLQQQVSILTTYKTSQEYYIADEKRKNAAFLEVIEMMRAEE